VWVIKLMEIIKTGVEKMEMKKQQLKISLLMGS
jgi:hypothetical protein